MFNNQPIISLEGLCNDETYANGNVIDSLRTMGNVHELLQLLKVLFTWKEGGSHDEVVDKEVATTIWWHEL